MPYLIFDCGCTFPIGGENDIHVSECNEFPPEIDINIADFPLDCPKVWRLIGEGRTRGIFQLEGHLGKSWSKKIKPSNIEEMADVISLIRPGCVKVKSGDPPKSTTERYCDRKHKVEPVEFFDPSLEDILDKTYGVICYQEQAMQIATKLAGFTEEDADILRKSIGKKKPEIMAKVKKMFLDGCHNTGIVSDEKAQTIFSWIQESQKYAFNKSHAVAYAMDGYWTAYIKAHFPIFFYCSYLANANRKQDKFKEIENLVNDAKLSSQTICVPDIRNLKSEHVYIDKGSIRFGIGEIKGLGGARLKKLINVIESTEDKLNKKIKDWSWLEYLIHAAPDINKQVNEHLIQSGALDCFSVPRQRMLYEYEQIKNNVTGKYEIEFMRTQEMQEVGSLPELLRLCARTRKEGGGCTSQKRIQKIASLASMIEKPPYDIHDTADDIAWGEKNCLGISITCSIVDARADATKANSTCIDVLTKRIHRHIIAVEVGETKEITTKNNDRMAFISVSDYTCMLECTVFPDVWDKYKDILVSENTVLIKGHKDNNYDTFVVEDVWQI